MNVRDRYDNDHYKNTLPYPTGAQRPAVLGKRAGDLTADEIASLPQAKADYEAALEQRKADRDAYSAREREIKDELRRDLEVEHGMTDHPKADLLWSKAWEYGHDASLGEVIGHYEDFVELVR